MTKERLEEVLKILSNYNESQSIVDYYQLFGLNKNMTVDEIKSQIKQRKLQVLFHPDQINFVPSEHHEKYLKMIEVTKDVINTFDSPKNKESYDRKLEESRTYSNYNSYNQNNNYNQDNSYQSNSWEEKTEDLDEVNLQQAIILNSEKYGFEYTRQSLIELIQYNHVDGFTRDNNVRNIIASIDKQKLKSIIIASSLNDGRVDMEQIVMNYLTDLVYKIPNLNIQETAIKEACVNTICKYDLNGHYNQTNIALDKYSTYGDASAFTNTNNARVNLINNVNYKNVKFFVQCSLNRQRFENPNLSYQYTKNMSKETVNKLYCDATLQKIKEDIYGTAGYDDSSYGGR